MDLNCFWVASTRSSSHPHYRKLMKRRLHRLLPSKRARPVSPYAPLPLFLEASRLPKLCCELVVLGHGGAGLAGTRFSPEALGDMARVGRMELQLA